MPTIVSIEGFHYQGATETTPSWGNRRNRGSDKCYLVALVDHGANGWAVHAHWGRRLSTGSGTRWGPWSSPSTARRTFEDKQSSKLAENYRRVNWTDPLYGMEMWAARFGTLPVDTNGWIKVADAANMLGGGLAGVARLIQRGQLTSRMIGGFECVRRMDVESIQNRAQAIQPPTTNGLDIPPGVSIVTTAAEQVAAPVAAEEALIADHVFGFGYRDRLTDVAFCVLCGQPQLQHLVKEPVPPPPPLILPDRVTRDVRPRIQIRRDLA